MPVFLPPKTSAAVVTQALANGLSGPVVASLLGHRSTKMIDEHYSHLDQRGELLKEAAKQATGRELI